MAENRIANQFSAWLSLYLTRNENSEMAGSPHKQLNQTPAFGNELVSGACAGLLGIIVQKCCFVVGKPPAGIPRKERKKKKIGSKNRCLGARHMQLHHHDTTDCPPTYGELISKNHSSEQSTISNTASTISRLNMPRYVEMARITVVPVSAISTGSSK